MKKVLLSILAVGAFFGAATATVMYYIEKKSQEFDEDEFFFDDDEFDFMFDGDCDIPCDAEESCSAGPDDFEPNSAVNINKVVAEEKSKTTTTKQAKQPKKDSAEK